MLPLCASLLSLAAIALAAYGLGCPVVRGLRLGIDDRLSFCVWSMATGLVLAAMLLAGLGLVGGLYASWIGILTLAGCFWAVGEIVAGKIRRQVDVVTNPRLTRPAWEESRQATLAPPPRWMTTGAIGLAGLALLGTLLSALAPPTAGDALAYHLELPKAFLNEHGLAFFPDAENRTAPMLVEMWFLWGLAIDGPVTAQLLHWLSGVLAAAATVVLATPILGRPWARLSGLVVLLVPGVTNQMTAPLNDVALILLTTLALAAWWQVVVNDQTGRWFILAGLFAGGALGTKYTALVFVIAVAATIVWTFCRRPDRRRCLVEGTAVVTLVAVSVAALWYVRAAWYQGNPIHPLSNEVLATVDADDGNLRETGPRQVIMGGADQLGVLFLAAVPGVIFCRRLRGLGMLLAVAGVYGVVWYLLCENVRFLFPVVPLAAVASVWVWAEMRRFPGLPKVIGQTAFAGIVAAHAILPLSQCGDRVAVACGIETRDEYLSRVEPTWHAAKASNQLLGSAGHLLSQDRRAFYFACPVTRESVYRRRTHYDRSIDEPADFVKTLRQAGFTHVLLVENEDDAGIQFDPAFGRLADAQTEDSLMMLREYHFEDADGAMRRYRLALLLTPDK